MRVELGAASTKEAGMRRWDGLVERCLQECEARGLAASTKDKRSRELGRLGEWPKRQRPKVALEGADADLIVRYAEPRLVRGVTHLPSGGGIG